MQPTITVDVGTTSVKLIAFDAAGTSTAVDRFPTPSDAVGVGDVYDVDRLVGGIADFVRALPAPVRAAVRRVAFAGVGESGALVRPDGSLASPVVLWYDQRGAASIARLTQEQRQEVWTRTGLPVNANYGVSKTAWAAQHAVDADDAQWLNVSEYLAARLTGRRWSEPSLASRTMALDLGTGSWSPEICDMFGLDVERFPAIRPAADGARITGPAAAALGLSEDVVVHVAGHDHVVGAVGAGLRPGELLNSTGTTEGLLVLRDAPALGDAVRDAKLANGRAAQGDSSTLFASIPTGGSAFATLQSMLAMPADRLGAVTDDLLGRYLAGALDLDAVPLVLPQFRGSPPPTKNARARGVVAGIGSDTTAEDLVLGCFLGLALQFRDVLDLFPEQPSLVRAIGPVTRNPLWVQLKADALARPVSVVMTDEVVSRGAQLLAAEADGPTPEPPRTTVVEPARTASFAAWADAVADDWQRLKDIAA